VKNKSFRSRPSKRFLKKFLSTFVMHRLLCLLFVIHRVASEGCFHGSSFVQTAEHGILTIQELAEEYQNARILTANAKGEFLYSPIKYWLHANPTLKHDYLEIRTNENEYTLSITPEHLMYTVENEKTDFHFRKVVQAAELKVDDLILIHSSNGELIASKILEIKAMQKEGIYAPVTVEGSLLVNNVLASSYTIFKNEYLQELFLDATFGYRRVIEYILPSSWIIPSFSGVQNDIPKLALQMLQLAQSFFG